MSPRIHTFRLLSLLILLSAHELIAGTLSMITQPQDVSQPAGVEAEFEVVVDAQGDVNYQWLHNGEVLPGETASFLILPSPQIANIGYYSVRVTDGTGTVESRNAKLTLLNRSAGVVIFVNSGVILDVDTQSPLKGTNFVAQLLIGPTSNLMASVGEPIPLCTRVRGGAR